MRFRVDRIEAALDAIEAAAPKDTDREAFQDWLVRLHLKDDSLALLLAIEITPIVKLLSFIDESWRALIDFNGPRVTILRERNRGWRPPEGEEFEKLAADTARAINMGLAKLLDDKHPRPRPGLHSIVVAGYELEEYGFLKPGAAAWIGEKWRAYQLETSY